LPIEEIRIDTCRSPPVIQISTVKFVHVRFGLLVAQYALPPGGQRQYMYSRVYAACPYCHANGVTRKH
jgi:hypothetical protein